MKYEFTGEAKLAYGRTLRRIRRLSDGALGGWLESEHNLAQEGSAWVYGNALVVDICSVRPVVLTGLRHHVTICDATLAWGCRSFDWMTLHFFRFSDCTDTNWAREEFETDLALVKQLCRAKWGLV